DLRFFRRGELRERLGGAIVTREKAWSFGEQSFGGAAKLQRVEPGARRDLLRRLQQRQPGVYAHGRAGRGASVPSLRVANGVVQRERRRGFHDEGIAQAFR